MGHVLPARVYYAVYGILLFLLVVTVGVAQINLGPFNILVAMLIAIVKAVLVILIFMGVKYGTKLTWVWATAGFVWLAVMFTILSDYFTRGWINIGTFR